MITLVAMLHWRLRLNGILSFWIAYILTRPLGASIGDSLSQSPADGRLGLRTVGTSALFLLTIPGLVSYLVVSRADVVRIEPKSA